MIDRMELRELADTDLVGLHVFAELPLAHRRQRDDRHACGHLADHRMRSASKHEVVDLSNT
jgi:hypothetical protein